LHNELSKGLAPEKGAGPFFIPFFAVLARKGAINDSKKPIPLTFRFFSPEVTSHFKHQIT